MVGVAERVQQLELVDQQAEGSDEAPGHGQEEDACSSCDRFKEALDAD